MVDAQAGCHASAGRIDVNRYVLARIDGVQIEQLCLQRIGGIIIDLRTEEDDAVHHQA